MLRFGLLRSLLNTQALENLESLELRMAHIERLIVAGPMVGGPECLGLRPRFEDGAVLPHCVGRIKSVILGFGPLSNWNSTKPGTLSRWVSRDSQTVSNASSDPLVTRKRFMAMNIVQPFWFWASALFYGKQYDKLEASILGRGGSCGYGRTA